MRNEKNRNYYMKKWREKNKDKTKKYSHNKKRRKQKREYMKKYRKRLKVKERRKEYNKKLEVKKKINATQLARNHIPIKGQICNNCKELATERHHEDYNKPYDVKFLCKKCHTLIHYPMSQ